MRHSIQRAGHEYMPVLFMVACFGSTLLFFLGNQYDGHVPGLIMVPTIALIAVCVEWATLTFGQDLQDTLTRGEGIAWPFIRAAFTYGVSVFFMANAAASLWAPRDALLGISDRVWAWVMAAFIFVVQFLLKLQKEQPKSPRSIVNIANAVMLWAGDEPPEMQAAKASKVFRIMANGAYADEDDPPRSAALPAPDHDTAISGKVRVPTEEEIQAGKPARPFQRKTQQGASPP